MTIINSAKLASKNSSGKLAPICYWIDFSGLKQTNIDEILINTLPQGQIKFNFKKDTLVSKVQSPYAKLGAQYNNQSEYIQLKSDGSIWNLIEIILQVGYDKISQTSISGLCTSIVFEDGGETSNSTVVSKAPIV